MYRIYHHRGVVKWVCSPNFEYNDLSSGNVPASLIYVSLTALRNCQVT